MPGAYSGAGASHGAVETTGGHGAAQSVRGSPWLLPLLAVVVAASGVVVSLCAGLVSRGVWRSEVASFPWGLVLGIAGSVGAVVLARAAGGRRLGIVAAAAWLLGIALVLFWHPGGDYLFANDGLGLTFLLGGPVAVTAAAAWTGGVVDQS